MKSMEGTTSFTIPYGRNNYCGPCALAYVLKTDSDSAAALLRKVSGKRSIRGVSNGHLTEAIWVAGVRTRLAFPIGNVPHPQLRRWLSTREDPAALYIVNITHHYIVVHGNQVFDSRFHLGKPLEKCPYLLRRVVNAWRVFPPVTERNIFLSVSSLQY